MSKLRRIECDGNLVLNLNEALQNKLDSSEITLGEIINNTREVISFMLSPNTSLLSDALKNTGHDEVYQQVADMYQQMVHYIISDQCDVNFQYGDRKNCLLGYSLMRNNSNLIVPFLRAGFDTKFHYEHSSFGPDKGPWYTLIKARPASIMQLLYEHGLPLESEKKPGYLSKAELFRLAAQYGDYEKMRLLHEWGCPVYGTEEKSALWAFSDSNRGNDIESARLLLDKGTGKFFSDPGGGVGYLNVIDSNSIPCSHNKTLHKPIFQELFRTYYMYQLNRADKLLENFMCEAEGTAVPHTQDSEGNPLPTRDTLSIDDLLPLYTVDKLNALFAPHLWRGQEKTALTLMDSTVMPEHIVNDLEHNQQLILRMQHAAHSRAMPCGKWIAKVSTNSSHVPAAFAVGGT